jgi:hypothetical protein
MTNRYMLFTNTPDEIKISELVESEVKCITQFAFVAGMICGACVAIVIMTLVG